MGPPDSHADLLEQALFAHYATVRADGAPQVNPMWFAWDPERGVIRMTHTKRRHNYRNVRREPRVALSITDPEDPYRYIQVRGVVESIEDDPTGRRGARTSVARVRAGAAPGALRVPRRCPRGEAQRQKVWSWS